MKTNNKTNQNPICPFTKKDCKSFDIDGYSKCSDSVDNKKDLIPENLVLKSNNGDIIRIDIYNEYLTKKPTVRLSCIEDDTITIDLDGEYIPEFSEATCYLNIDIIDKMILKLQEARVFLNCL